MSYPLFTIVFRLVRDVVPNHKTTRYAGTVRKVNEPVEENEVAEELQNASPDNADDLSVFKKAKEEMSRHMIVKRED